MKIDDDFLVPFSSNIAIYYVEEYLSLLRCGLMLILFRGTNFVGYHHYGRVCHTVSSLSQSCLYFLNGSQLPVCMHSSSLILVSYSNLLLNHAFLDSSFTNLVHVPN